MKKTILTAALLTALCSSSCLGPDNLHHSVKNWNATMSDNDVVKELVFVAFVIIPVYQIAWLGDVLIFNTVSYWSGEPPIKDPGAFPGFKKTL